MSVLVSPLRRVYGSHPLHLMTMIAGFALVGYIIVTFNPATLWNPDAWWQSIAIWLAAAIVLHDLALFPLYAIADRLLGIAARRRPRRRCRQLNVPARNYVRIPALASGLTLLIFWPGILRQSTATYLAATGQTQQPFLGRWLLLTAFTFSASALGYAVRLVLARRSVRHVDHQAAQATDRPADTHFAKHLGTQPDDSTTPARSPSQAGNVPGHASPSRRMDRYISLHDPWDGW